MRLKKKAIHTNRKKKPGRKPKNIHSDSRIILNSKSRFRLIEYIDPDSQIAYQFLTSRQDLSTQAVADIYKGRWQIELFFNQMDKTKSQISKICRKKPQFRRNPNMDCPVRLAAHLIPDNLITNAPSPLQNIMMGKDKSVII